MYKAQFDKKRKFGVELEFFGCNQFELQHTLTQWGILSKIELYENPDVPHWTITTDNSIQGEDATELKSPILCGERGLSEVKRVLTLLDYLECQINSSCGLHVHWHVEDFTGADVLALLRLYSKFENVIDGLVSLDRREDKNIHCRSLVRDDTLAWIGELDKVGNSIALEIVQNFRNIYHSRRDKVNIASYLKHSTVEFRHHEGTTNIDETLNWITFTQALVNRAKHASVSKELSASPTLSEMTRVLGLADFQNCTDPLMIQTRTWMKSKYADVRKKKKELVTVSTTQD